MFQLFLNRFTFATALSYAPEMIRFTTRSIFLLLFASSMNSTLLSQPIDQNDSSNPNRRAVTVRDTFDPSFNIEPLFHKLNGRGGDGIAFKFQIEAKDQQTEVEVQPIGLRQDISGQIMFDATAQATELITLITPTRMVLEKDKSANIEGLVQLPRSFSKHHSLGILVRDLGRSPNMQSKTNPDGTRATQAGISFVTQYVLRLDLEVDGARGENPSMLRIDDLRLVPHDGRPKLQAVLSNASGSTFEFEVRAKIRGSDSERNKPIRLALPARSQIEEESRFVSRILPQSKVRMEEFLPDAIASGRYEVDIEIVVNDRVAGKSTHPLFVDAKNFPAQETLIAQVGEDLQVSPAQIELSQLRGGTRRLTMQLKNVGGMQKSIRLNAKSLDGLISQSVNIQPDEFVLAPNSTRRVAITLKGKPSATDVTEYGSLLVETKDPSRDFQESRELPMALLFKKQPAIELELSPLVWDSRNEYPAFRTTVKNVGQGHVGLDARLSIFSRSGQRVNVYSGFGKWLMPGKSMALEFRLEQPLQPGEYLLRYELQNGTDKPISKDQSITVSDLENAVTSR